MTSIQTRQNRRDVCYNLLQEFLLRIDFYLSYVLDFIGVRDVVDFADSTFTRLNRQHTIEVVVNVDQNAMGTVDNGRLVSKLCGFVFLQDPIIKRATWSEPFIGRSAAATFPPPSEYKMMFVREGI
jgi:hypothetical protein